MSRQNRKEQVAALHRAHILAAAESLFLEKGVSAATIADISAAAGYSRRTIYAYYENKADILHHIVLNGLLALKAELADAVGGHGAFIAQYRAVCSALERYQTESPQSADAVNRLDARHADTVPRSPVAEKIFACGTEINALLAAFIESGKRRGSVRPDVEPLKTVYVLWASLSALHTLASSKETVIVQTCGISREQFLEYGYRQLINSIVPETMRWE